MNPILPISDTPLFSTQLPAIEPGKMGEIEAKAAMALEGPPSTGFYGKGFIQLNCASSLARTDLEGDVPSSAFVYLGHLLDKMENVNKMKQVIEELIHFDLFHGSTEEMAADIVDRCGKNGMCYLPSGWITLDSGHYLSLKVRQIEGSRVAFSILNQGDGMQFHTPFKHPKGKRDFQSTEFEIDLSSKEGLDFLSRIRKFKEVLPHEKIKALSAKEMYGLLRIYGRPLKKSDFRAATQQRTGVCPSANTRAALKDALLADGAITEKELKTFQYQLKRISVIEAYQCGAHKDPKMIPFVKDALDEWDVRLLKLYPEILPAEEFALDQAIIKKIRAEMVSEPKKEALVSLKTLEIPIKPGSVIPSENSTAPAVEKRPKRLQIIPAAELNPDAVVDYLDRAIKINERNSLSLDEFMQIYQMMINLPTPSGEAIDPFWDNVPENQIESIFDKFNHIRSRIDEFYGFGYLEVVYHIETYLIAYDIAAQLAGRLRELKLGQWYTPALNEVFYEADFFENPASYARVKRIYANFANRSKDKKKILGHVISIESRNDRLNSIHESTREYVMNTLLTEWDKKKARKFFKGSYEPRDYSDKELFTDLMCKHGCAPLPNPFISLMSLSVTAHASNKYSHICYDKGSLHSFGYLQCRGAREELMEANMNSDSFTMYVPPKTPYAELHRCIENITFYPGRVTSDYDRASQYFEGRSTGTSKCKESMECIDLQTDEDLRLIDVEPCLQVQKCLEWAALNVERLKDKNVQKRIHSLLFQYGLLDRALEEFPEDLLHLYRLFETKFLKTYLAGERDTLLWGIELLTYLKEHIQTHPAAAKFHIEGVNTRPILIDLLQKKGAPKRKIAQLIIQSYGHGEAPLEMLKWGVFAAKFYAPNPSRLDFYTAALLAKVKEKQFSEEELNTFGNEVFALCTGDTAKRQWRLVDHQLQAGDFTIDLQSLKLTKSHLTITDLTDQLQDNPLMIQFFGDRLPPMTLKESVATTIDGRWQIELDPNCTIVNIVQHVTLKEQKTTLTLDMAIKTNWKVGESIFTYSGNTGWLSSNGNFTEELVLKGEEWVASGQLLLNEKGAYKCLADYGEFDLIFAKGEPARLQKVIFKKLGLSFIPKGENLECVEHPGFLLWQNDIPGAFTLKKGNETKVLIPAYTLSSAKSLAFGGSWKRGVLLFDADPYFSYTLDASGELLGQTPEANLYLALLYRGKNEFKKAKKALEASETFERNSPLCWAIFLLLKNLPNKSPAAIAFDCHMTYRMHQHAAKWSKKGSTSTVDQIEAYERFSLYQQYESVFGRSERYPRLFAPPSPR